MTFATAVLFLLLTTTGFPAVESEAGELVLRVCKIELTEAGRRARFSFHYLYALRTDPLGRVVAVERRTEREYPPFVREERFEPCLRSWQLSPSSDYGVTIRVGTNVLENTITVQRAGDPRLRLLVPRAWRAGSDRARAELQRDRAAARRSGRPGVLFRAELPPAMTAETLHRQAMVATLLAALGLSACAHLQPAAAITQGIRGRIEFHQGDFEPPGVGHISYVRRKVLFHEKTDLDQVVDDGTFFSKIKTRRLASTRSDEEGYFEIELPVGEYSLFVIEEGKYYSNLFDGYGYIFPVTVEKDRVAEVRFVISYRAAI